MAAFYGEITTNGINYKITEHFVEKLRTRLKNPKLKKKEIIALLEGSIADTIVIKDRPNNVRVLLRNGIREAIYLYHPERALLFVVEKDRGTCTFSVLRTVYTASESGWLQYWLNKTPKTQRTMWKDFVTADSIGVLCKESSVTNSIP